MEAVIDVLRSLIAAAGGRVLNDAEQLVLHHKLNDLVPDDQRVGDAAEPPSAAPAAPVPAAPPQAVQAAPMSEEDAQDFADFQEWKRSRGPAAPAPAADAEPAGAVAGG